MKVIEENIGEWGRYQACLYALLFLPGAISGCQTLLFTFTGAVPKHRCFIAGVDNSTSPEFKNRFISDKESLAHLYPEIEKEGGKIVFCDSCQPKMADLEGGADSLKSSANCTKEAASGCGGAHVYDRSQYHTSLAMKFNMVCDSHWKRDLAKSMFMVGKLIGSVVFGIISDLVGRRPVFLICCFVGIVSFNVVPVLPTFWLICVFQIINGTVTYGAYLTAFVFVMEIVGGYYKTVCGVMVQAFFTVGYLYVGLCAYLIRRFEHLQWVVSAPVFLLAIIPYWYIIPESIRWLTVRGRIDEAQKIIEKAAKFNKRQVNSEKIRGELEVAAHEMTQEQKRRANVLHLFISGKGLAFNTIIVCFTWFAVAMTYYGLSYNADDLPGDDYTNFILLGVAEIPGLVACILIMEKFGRRIALTSLMCGGGLACVFAAAIPPSKAPAAIVVLAMIGKAAISGAFAVVYNYSAELYPTVVRQSACGFSSLVGRIGSILAPQIHLLGKHSGSYVPLLIYGLVAFAAGLTDILLPETKNKVMPDTLEQSSAFSKQNLPSFLSKLKRPHKVDPTAASEGNPYSESKL